ncbi:MAG: ABC transporter substrate binding protein [Pseudomonadota bacterium]|nr:ABC transporter substrate binding protein [Pseudomonadota bacterium]
MILKIITMSLLSCSLLVAGAEPKKILYIDSYHLGYEWSDGIRRGILEVLPAEIELKSLYLDTKRHAQISYKKAVALTAKAVIDTFKPDVVIACDDNAAQYLIQPYYQNSSLPFVFCGLNWDASSYGFPYPNVTGMVEVTLLPQIMKQLKHYAHGQRLGLLSADTATDRKVLAYHQKTLHIKYDRIYFVNTFADWQAKYLQLQQEVDTLILLNVVGIHHWDLRQAQYFVEQHTQIPSGSEYRWLMPLSLLGIVIMPEEQGRWSAHAALKILQGIPPYKIPITHNKQSQLLFNARLSQKLGITPPKSATLINNNF